MKLCRNLLWLAAMLTGIAAHAETITYYHNDIAGSPVVATDAGGNVLWRESYRPYGERLTNAPASADNKVWFTSRPQDMETGLVYMGARYYDPVVGRFISKDPMEFDERNLHTYNRYAYANNNPYRYHDPDGRASAALFAIGGGAAALLMIPEQKRRELGAALAGGILGLYNIYNEGADEGGQAKPSSASGSDGQKTVDQLIGESARGRETKGRADQYVHEGGREQGDRDFESLGVNEVKDRGKGTKTGVLPDGRSVNIHDSKQDGTRTIQIGNGNREIKIRYPE